MKLEWFISWRYLVRKRKDFFLSAVTVIAILGIAIAVMTVLVVIAVMTGFDRELEEKITRNLPPLVVRKDDKIENYAGVVDKVSRIEHVTRAVAFLQGEGLIKYADRIQGFSIIGVDTTRQDVLNEISRKIEAGELELGERKVVDGGKELSLHGIVLGRELAIRLGVPTGARVDCISASLSKKAGVLVPSQIECEVTGIFTSGVYDIDSALAYVSLRSAQRLFDIGDFAGGIDIKIDDIYLADAVAEDIENVLGPAFFATTWMQTHRNLFSALRLEKTTMFVILALIILVAAFNITGTLIMVVMDKTKDIGILKSIGVRNLGVMRIFVLEGMLIGCAGIIVGLGAGYALCSFLKKFPLIRLPGEIYLIDRLPVQISAGDFASICAVAFLMSLLSTLYPAWRANRVSVVEALRYE